MAGALWKAFVFGAVVAGAIGPIALLIFGTAARAGIAAGLFAGAGAALADLVYALAAFSVGALVLPLVAAHQVAIRTGCGLLLVGLGAWMLLAAVRQGGPPATARPDARAFLPTFGLTVINPMTLVVFAGIVPQLPVAGSLANAAVLAVALSAGSLLVQSAIAATGAGFGAALPGEGGRRAVTAVAAAGIVAFGIYGLAAAI